MNVLGVGAPAPTSLSSSALHFRLKVTNILPPSPIYHSRTVMTLSNSTRGLSPTPGTPQACREVCEPEAGFLPVTCASGVRA